MKNIKKLILVLLMGTQTGAVIGDTNDIDNSILVEQLSLASAIQAAQLSISTCRKNGHQVSATVVNQYGQEQVMLRDTSASYISVVLSRKKAFTAANFQKDTTQLANLSDTAVGRSEGVLMSAGGVLIKVDDVIYGAVGVSGAATGAGDDTCATAGAEAIIEALKNDKRKSRTKSEASSNKVKQ